MTKNNILSGVADGYTPFVIADLFKKHKNSLFVILSSDEKATLIHEQLTLLYPDLPSLLFPAWDCLPYDRVAPSQDVVQARLKVLRHLMETKTSSIIVTSAAAVLQKVIPLTHFKGQNYTLKCGASLNQQDFLEFLQSKGYSRSDLVRDHGEYAVRGDIIDLFPSQAAAPIRIDLFGDDIEKLRTFDPITQVTTGTSDNIELHPSSEIILTPENIATFRLHYRQLFGVKATPLYEAISEGRRYNGAEHWLSLFYGSLVTLFDYCPEAMIVAETEVDAAIRTRLELVDDYYHNRQQRLPGDNAAAYNPVPPTHLFLGATEWEAIRQQPKFWQITSFSQENTQDFQCRQLLDFSTILQQHNIYDYLKTFVAETLQEKSQIIFTALSDGSRERLAHIMAEHGLKNIEVVSQWPTNQTGCFLTTFPLEKGYTTPTTTVITEQDLLGDRVIRTPAKRRQSQKFIISTGQLTTGDLIVHRDHGIGRYQGLEAIHVGAALHDCLCLVYADGDKLYLPVENIEAISRYGNDESVSILDKLGSAAWQMRKAKVKKRIREIAEYLIKLAAERSLHQGTIIEGKAEEIEEFCARFPYPETDDQLNAIADTLNDMSNGKPMDRLLCGDVGFGKTEVALRAAFVVASSGKQTAIVTPTTLLCRQHFKTFSERFQGFPYRVAQLSRFVTPKQAESVRQGLANGEIDVVIATHALFSDKIKFADLGLLVIDEEQHFGVKQKEKIKGLQKDVHVLTVTATPIPRTLQLALSGVREMSLITTPPVDRLAVRTFVTPYDPLMIREAILREHYRGGQTFFVCPRLEEMAKLENNLRELIPEIKIVVAHGQMPAAQLEAVMTAFYDREYDVLLSTNIVESGIDIANANTLIIHRADLFGLAQLYQLRGRVGRSKTQGYAYLTLLPNQVLSETSKKRLEIMQTLDKLGAGFTLASHDMDIRGTGNIVGEEQSGHIREVGVELYQNLLQEAIMMVRAEQELRVHEDADWTPQINLGTSVMIPESYVPELNVRLDLYRRIAGLRDRAEIESYAAEMIDRFGKLPEEVQNLFEIIEIKSWCRLAAIEKVDAGPKGLVISFYQNTFKNPAALMQYIQQPNVNAKLRPDHKVVFLRDWPIPAQRVRSAKNICANIARLVR